MKQLELSPDEAINYLKDNVKIHDNLEISYNRVFGSGEVLNMDFSEYFGKSGFKMLLALDGESINTTTEIDVFEIKDDLIEFIHHPKEGEAVEVTVV